MVKLRLSIYLHHGYSLSVARCEVSFANVVVQVQVFICIFALKKDTNSFLITASTHFSLAKTYYLVFVCCALLVQSTYLSPRQVFCALGRGEKKFL